MISRALCALVAVAGCRGDEPNNRARVLDTIPASATSIFAASGRALSHPRFRPLVDVLRPDVPAGFDCVVDAALAADQVAGGIDANGDVTIAISTHALVKCGALSQVEPGLWIATLGGAAPAAAGSGVTTVPEHARALPFLRDAPIALVTSIDDTRVLATAQPDPLAAWAAFDSADAPSAAAFAKDLTQSLDATNSIATFAGIARHISIDRQGSQVVARLGAYPGDLAVPLRATLERARIVPAARAFPCPSPQAPVQNCRELACTTPLSCAVDHDVFAVVPIVSAFEALVGANWEPVVSNGRVEGVRLREDLATYGLRRGDVLVSIDGKRVTGVEQVEGFVALARTKVSLIVSRGRRFGTIDYAFPEE